MITSIIIPTYNKLPRLKLTLCSLKCNTCFEKTEIIIANDGSDDGTIEYLNRISKKNKNLKVINSGRTGRAAARNSAAEHANGDLLIFCDDDIIVSNDFILRHLHEHCLADFIMVHNKIMSLDYLRYFIDPTNGIPFSNYESRNFSVLQRKCINKIDIKESFEEKIVSQAKRTHISKVIEYIFANHLQYKYGWISSMGTCVSISRKAFESLEGFDVKYGLNWGGEDFDFGYRFSQSGGQFKYTNELTSYHITHHREGWENSLKMSLNYFYEKFHDKNILKILDVLTKESDIERLRL